jgi:hypothetical protein
VSAEPPSHSLALVSVDHIHLCPIQPRVNVSVELVRRLADSMRAGRHDPLLEVEPHPERPGEYQIVCGEQRWRAAKEASLDQVLVRVHRPLGYLERLQKQHEENHLRTDLGPVEEGQLVLLTKALRDVAVAERLLHDAGVPFQLLDDKRITDRAEIHEHLDSLKALLLERKVHVVQTDSGPAVGPLSPWRETERALGISEAGRKAKVAVLRLEPEVLEDVNALPAYRAGLIARVDGHERRAQLVERAPSLSKRQLHAVVDRLRRDPELTVAEAVDGRAREDVGDPLAFESQLDHLCDLCRQVVRLLGILRGRQSPEEKEQVQAVLRDLSEELNTFQEVG